MKRHIGIVLSLFLLSCSNAASADPGGWELGIGYADEIDGEGSGVAALSWLTDSRHPYEFIVGHIQSRSGNLETPSSTFLGVSRRLTFKERWFISAGVALTDVENDVLSSTGQFLTGGGYTADAWSITLRHLSNADTGGRNRGETFLLVSFHF